MRAVRIALFTTMVCGALVYPHTVRRGKALSCWVSSAIGVSAQHIRGDEWVSAAALTNKVGAAVAVQIRLFPLRTALNAEGEVG